MKHGRNPAIFHQHSRKLVELGPHLVEADPVEDEATRETTTKRKTLSQRPVMGRPDITTDAWSRAVVKRARQGRPNLDDPGEEHIQDLGPEPPLGEPPRLTGPRFLASSHQTVRCRSMLAKIRPRSGVFDVSAPPLFIAQFETEGPRQLGGERSSPRPSIFSPPRGPSRAGNDSKGTQYDTSVECGPD